MYAHLIALEKQPEICPVDIEETWRHLFSSTNVFQVDQLCTILKGGIYGALYGIQAVWDANSSTENWGFLLFDAQRVQ